MAVIQFEKSHLQKMIGRKLTEKEYEERIPLFGCPLEKMEPTAVHFEVSPNRPDLLSIEGFARTMKNFLSDNPKLTNYKVKKGKLKVKVNPSVKKVRPEIVCAVVRNVKITDDLIASLMQVQEKLHDTLGRKRKKVAIGIHDMKKLKAPFTYKGVSANGIKFVPLDMGRALTPGQILEEHPKGISYAHLLENSNKYPIIVDKNNRVLSFPPVINGELTRVTSKTKTLFIDVTGTDELAITQALNIITTSFADRGCTIESVQMVSGNKKTTTPDLNRWKIKADADYINKILGLQLNRVQMTKLLRKMDIGFDGKWASVPAYRTDIMHQMDIAEDVAIAYGYDKFEPTVPTVPTIGRPLAKYEYHHTVKQLMVGLGFQEVINLTLSNFEDEFDKMNAKREAVAETLNSVTPECNIVRKDIMPSLMDVLANNQHYEYPQRIFEVGDTVVIDKKAETLTRNVKKLACAVADMRVSYQNASSILHSLMGNLGFEYQLKKTEHPTFIGGRVADIIVKGKAVGRIGEIHPSVLKNWKLNVPVVAFEIDLEKL